MKKRLVLFLSITLIVCLLGSIFFACTSKRTTNSTSSVKQTEEQKNNGSGQNDASVSAEENRQQGSSSFEEDPLVKQTAIVRFLNTDYSIISSQQVRIGDNAVPPIADFVPAQAFFTKWDGNFRAITSETNIFPVYTDVSSVRNAIGFNSVYTELSQSFSVEIEIQGDVNFAGLDLMIEYDAGITIDSVIPCKGFAEYSHLAAENKIVFSFANATTITGAMTLLTIKGSCLKAPLRDPAVKINVISLSAFDEEGEIKDAQYAVFNGSIYVI